jgi:hypothetical protein
MALAFGLIRLVAVVVIFLIITAWGTRMLTLVRCQSEDSLESLLFAAGFSFAVLEVILFFLSVLDRFNLSFVIALFILFGTTAWSGWRVLWNNISSLCARVPALVDNIFDRAVILIAGLVLMMEGLLAMAPLTGSDAMQYHFTVPFLARDKPLEPLFGLVLSFLTGQAHLLISLGLVLGSDRISLALIYLGGVLATAALYALSRHLMPRRWGLGAVLIFVCSPIVCWQVGISGSPDIWMVFFVTISALAASRAVLTNTDRWFVLAGLFAGGAAGIKYTAWVLPFALVLYILWRRRSIKVAFLSSIASLVAGVWPIARNLLWTGDPVFPFLTPLLTPDRVNWYTLQAVRSAAAGTAQRDLIHMIAFPFAMTFKGNEHGLGQLFGPLILALGPLLLCTPWKKPVAQIAGAFWAVMYLSILVTSQMGRFLLPVFALSLALVFSGTAEIFERGSRLIKVGIASTILSFLIFALASDAVYASSFLGVVLGKEDERTFLERMAPDYRTVEFINSELKDQASADAVVMVFFRHLYYLRVPFADGAPEYSWSMNPVQYSDKNRLLEHLHEMKVRWVVKSPDFPAALKTAFDGLEADGDLVPEASADIDALVGTGRIYGEHQKVHVVILRVRN